MNFINTESNPFLDCILFIISFLYSSADPGILDDEGGEGGSPLHLRFTNKMSQLIRIYQHLSVRQELGKSLLRESRGKGFVVP